MNGSDDTGPRVALVVANSEWVVATFRYYRSHRWGSVRRWNESPGVGEWSFVLSACFTVQTNENHNQHHTLTVTLSLVSAKMRRLCMDFLDSFVAYCQDVKVKCCYVCESVKKILTVYFCQLATKPDGELTHWFVPYPSFMKANS